MIMVRVLVSFTLTAGKMENAIANYRNILDIQKPV
jgi:hypothetical protein